MNWRTEPNTYGPRYYYLHREMILQNIRRLQKERGVINPSHLNCFRIVPVAGLEANTVEVTKGKRLEFTP